jgi:IS30 family transposase
LGRSPRLQQWVYHKLRWGWSPEQIAQALRRAYSEDTTMRISHEGIYHHVYVLPRGELRRELLAGLRRGHRRRHRRRALLEAPRKPLAEMISIDQRPPEVAARTVPGHWEGDLLVGRYRQSALGTLVERTTRFLLLVPLKRKTAAEVRQAFGRAVRHLPGHAKRSLTYDQGREMAEHRQLTRDTQMQVYFAHPASPWERGTNENTNGLIRQYFPKGTDFTQVPRRELTRVQRLLNGRPRKVLQWRSPQEAWQEDVALKS